MNSFTPKYLPFLHFTEGSSYHHSFKEHDLIDLDFKLKYARVLYIEFEELKRPIKYRLFCTNPVQIKCQEEYERKAHREHIKAHKTLQINYGIYYDPDALVLIDDLIAYNHHHIKFEQIRTARMLNAELLKEKSIKSRNNT